MHFLYTDGFGVMGDCPNFINSVIFISLAAVGLWCGAWAILARTRKDAV